MATAWAMKQWLCGNEKTELAINAGIAGSFNRDIPVGSVVMPVSDCYSDLGIETTSGIDPLSETPFMPTDKFPFVDGRIICNNKFSEMAGRIIKPVRAVTTNTSTGTETTAEKIRRLWEPDIETMEGAAFFYICSMEKIPFLSLRAISNMVGPREINKWDISLALSNLSDKIKDFLLLID